MCTCATSISSPLLTDSFSQSPLSFYSLPHFEYLTPFCCLFRTKNSTHFVIIVFYFFIFMVFFKWLSFFSSLFFFLDRSIFVKSQHLSTKRKRETQGSNSMFVPFYSGAHTHVWFFDLLFVASLYVFTD
jgi:hypothetical protein